MFTQIFISFFLFSNSLFSALFLPVSLAAVPVKAALPTPRNEQKGLMWQADRKLTWEDFQSKVDPNEPLHAMTSTNIEVQANCYGNQMEFDVKCVFLTRNSWSKNKQSESLLAHEQLHFDLTEVHARRLRQKLNLYPGLCSGNKAQFNKIVETYFADWKKEQEQYDRESNHGLNEAQQRIWENKTARRLEALQAFAHPASHQPS